jgi:hypothetical protein
MRKWWSANPKDYGMPLRRTTESGGELRVTTVLVASLGHVALVLPVALAPIFGAAVAATDPVAKVATIRRLGAPGRMCNLIETPQEDR